MLAAERSDLITRYAEGPALLRRTLARVPEAALQWRPAPGKWSAHEIIVHCADSECSAYLRIRFLVAEPGPMLMGYDQDAWATILDYHSRSIELALTTIDAVRASTVPLIQSLSLTDWARMGTHSESGAYGAEDWLRSYGQHLEIHSRQIERNLEAWAKR